MALIYNSFGVIGLKLLNFSCAGAVMTLLALGLAKTRAGIAVQFAAPAVVALALIQQIQFRPQLFDYVLFAALIAMLARETYGRGARLWLFQCWRYGRICTAVSSLVWRRSLSVAPLSRRKASWCVVRGRAPRCVRSR